MVFRRTRNLENRNMHKPSYLPLAGAAALLAAMTLPCAAAENAADAKSDLASCITRHRSETVEHKNQRNVYAHNVWMTNSCKETVRARVCYKGTKQCVVPEVRAGKEKMTRLGIKTGQSSFEYDLTVLPAKKPAKQEAK